MTTIARQLKIMGVRKVVFTGPSPHWTTDLPKIVVRLWEEIPRRTRVGLDGKVLELNTKLKNNFKPSGIAVFVSIIDHFCNSSGCLVYIGDNIEDGLTTWDYGHLSPMASAEFAKNVLAEEVLRVPEE